MSPLKETKMAQAIADDLKYKELFKALHDCNCAGRILCESPEMENDALVMQKAWEKIKG